MRRMLVVGGASLGIHIWLFSLVAGYRELVFRVGSLFPHHHDVADILVVGGAGFTASWAKFGDVPFGTLRVKRCSPAARFVVPFEGPMTNSEKWQEPA